MPNASPKTLPADLIYVSDALPGISRVPQRGHFRFRDAKGNWLTDCEDIRRIRRLAIPPAYTDVWICPLANGHLQATSRRKGQPLSRIRLLATLVKLLDTTFLRVRNDEYARICGSYGLTTLRN